MIRSSLIGVFIALSYPALAGPLEGRWAVTGEACAAESEVGDRRPIAIVGDTINFHESSCVIAEMQPIGDNNSAWTVVRTCSGEGETWSITSIFAIDRDVSGAPRQLIEINLGEGHVIVRQHCD